MSVIFLTENLCFRTVCQFWTVFFNKPLFCLRYPDSLFLCPTLNKLFLHFVYFPICWARLAASNIFTCCNALSRDITYEDRPNEERTSRADSCMLWLIKLRNVTFSILYITYLFFNLMKIILIHKYYLCNYRCKVTYYF